LAGGAGDRRVNKNLENIAVVDRVSFGIARIILSGASRPRIVQLKFPAIQRNGITIENTTS
jgi:hypothetical protein